MSGEYTTELSRPLKKAVVNTNPSILSGLPEPTRGMHDLIAVSNGDLVSPIYFMCTLDLRGEWFSTEEKFARFMQLLRLLLDRELLSTAMDPSTGRVFPFTTVIRERMKYRHHVLGVLSTLRVRREAQMRDIIDAARGFGCVEPGSYLHLCGKTRRLTFCEVEFVVAGSDVPPPPMHPGEVAESRPVYRRLNELFFRPDTVEVTLVIAMIAGSQELMAVLPLGDWRMPRTGETILHIAARCPLLRNSVEIVLGRFPMIHPALRDAEGRIARSDDPEIQGLIASAVAARFALEVPMILLVVRALKGLPPDVLRALVEEWFPACGCAAVV